MGSIENRERESAGTLEEGMEVAGVPSDARAKPQQQSPRVVETGGGGGPSGPRRRVPDSTVPYQRLSVHLRPKIHKALLQVWNSAGFRCGPVTPFARSVTQNGAQCQGSVTI